MAMMLLVVMLMSDVLSPKVYGHHAAKHYPVPWDRRGVTIIKQCWAEKREITLLWLLTRLIYLQEYLCHCSPGSCPCIKACFPVSMGQDHLQKVLLTFCFLGLKTPCQRLLNLLFSDAFEDGFAVERFCSPLVLSCLVWRVAREM